MSRWADVCAWRDRLREAPLTDVVSPLSSQGLQAGVHAALNALSDDALMQARRLQGRAWPRAGVVLAGTVPTSCIEWAALLLGRGSQVVLKHPSGAPGLTQWLVQHAGNLPLSATDDRSALSGLDAIIAMGSDDSVNAIRDAAHPKTAVFAHGHAWSCAWVTGRNLPPDPLVPSAFQAPWNSLAADVSLYDGRGCLSPAIVFTDLPIESASATLLDALQQAQRSWPAGIITAAESANIRSRRALSRVLGSVLERDGLSVHVLPASHAQPISLPRSVALVSVPNVHGAIDCARRWGASLSTVGTDDPESADLWFDAGATRVCRVGRMQRPPIHRVHDGTLWVHQTLRSVGLEMDRPRP